MLSCLFIYGIQGFIQELTRQYVDVALASDSTGELEHVYARRLNRVAAAVDVVRTHGNA